MIAFSLHSFNQGFYYLDYLVNKAAYVQKCVNKSRPQLHCNGHCLLMKKIREKEQREERDAPALKQMLKTEVVSSRSFFATVHFFPCLLASKYYDHTLADIVDRTHSIFHPPQA